MSKLDRLSALIGRFELNVTQAPLSEANLVITADPSAQTPNRVLFSPLARLVQHLPREEPVIFAAQADWGGASNPFLSALPDPVILSLKTETELIHAATLLQLESQANRCGSGAVLNRLGEIILIRILRSQIEAGTTDASLIGGLADARISRAIVAIHDAPGRRWKGTELARLAGLSHSRFAEVFRDKVGLTPAAYLRRWRMALARQDAKRGDRIQTIARRYGYSSAEALSRAFKREHNETAISLRSQSN